MTNSYPWEKFYDATGVLATSSAPLQQRVADAFNSSLDRLFAHPADVPSDIMRQLEEYRATWQAMDDPAGIGRLNVWADSLSEENAHEIATWIFDSFCEIARVHLKETT